MASTLTFVVSPCHAVIDLNLSTNQWTDTNAAASTLDFRDGKCNEDGNGNLLFTTDGSSPTLILTLNNASFGTQANDSDTGHCDACTANEDQRWTCRSRA